MRLSQLRSCLVTGIGIVYFLLVLRFVLKLLEPGSGSFLSFFRQSEPAIQVLDYALAPVILPLTMLANAAGSVLPSSLQAFFPTTTIEQLMVLLLKLFEPVVGFFDSIQIDLSRLLEGPKITINASEGSAAVGFTKAKPVQGALLGTYRSWIAYPYNRIFPGNVHWVYLLAMPVVQMLERGMLAVIEILDRRHQARETQKYREELMDYFRSTGSKRSKSR